MLTEADKHSHPWPIARWFDFRWRKSVWMSVRPWYGPVGSFSFKDITRLFIWRAKFPFFSYRITWKGKDLLHGYIGWKPIPVALDPQFGWRDLEAAQEAIKNGELFVQLSARGGYGKIS